MPRISTFYGIAIFMYPGDHAPPHFHAVYGEHRARVGLDGRVLEGGLPRRASGLVKKWSRLHGRDLAVCWDRVTHHEPPGTIPPLP